ncbi:MAG: fructoselysine 6-kinase [Firmicutes bacterium]|nr:fructoselysine 6-kinase [Bacillota bacterium]
MKAVACKAVAVGDNCIDNYLAPINRRFVGGNAVNVAVALRRHGIATAYVGAVGEDDYGRLILDALRAEDIDVSMVQVLSGVTGYTDVTLKDGDRIIGHEELGVMRDFKLDERTLDFIVGHRLVHNTLLGQTAPYLRRFKEAGMCVSFDYSEMRDEAFLSSTLPYVDIAFVSLPGAEWENAMQLATALTTRGPSLAVVTMGAAGSVASDGKNTWYQVALPVARLVDTLGAGDAFIGTFLAYYLRQEPVHIALREAARYASRTCTHLGAWVAGEGGEYDQGIHL